MRSVILRIDRVNRNHDEWSPRLVNNVFAEMGSILFIHVIICPPIQYVLSIAAGFSARRCCAEVTNKPTASTKE